MIAQSRIDMSPTQPQLPIEERPLPWQFGTHLRLFNLDHSWNPNYAQGPVSLVTTRFGATVSPYANGSRPSFSPGPLSSAINMATHLPFGGTTAVMSAKDGYWLLDTSGADDSGTEAVYGFYGAGPQSTGPDEPYASNTWTKTDPQLAAIVLGDSSVVDFSDGQTSVTFGSTPAKHG